MANHPSALKRMRQNEKRRARNRSIRSRVRTHIRQVHQAVEGRQVDEAQQALRAAMSILHKSVSKGVYHRNTASRQIGRLAKKVNAVS